MYANRQNKCSKCSSSFWVTADEQQLCQQQKRPLPNRCPACRSTDTAAESSTGLADAKRLHQEGNTGLGPLLPNSSAAFADIIKLLHDSAAPIEHRRRTFWEWCQGLDLEAKQIEKKLRAGDAADQLLRQRLDLIRKLQEVGRMQYEATEAEMAQRQRLLQAHLEQLKLG